MLVSGTQQSDSVLYMCVCIYTPPTHTHIYMGFPCSSGGKESACNARDLGLIPGSVLGERHGNPSQYSCLETPTDRGAWQAIQFMGSQKSDMTYLVNQHHIHKHTHTHTHTGGIYFLLHFAGLNHLFR